MEIRFYDVRRLSCSVTLGDCFAIEKARRRRKKSQIYCQFPRSVLSSSFKIKSIVSSGTRRLNSKEGDLQVNIYSRTFILSQAQKCDTRLAIETPNVCEKERERERKILDL